MYTYVADLVEAEFETFPIRVETKLMFHSYAISIVVTSYFWTNKFSYFLHTHQLKNAVTTSFLSAIYVSELSTAFDPEYINLDFMIKLLKVNVSVHKHSACLY